MRKYNGFDEAKKSARQTGSASLPLGTYVCQIKNIRVLDEDNDKERMEILYDIAEGEQKDFYKKQYEANTDEDKKWKGKTLIWSPKDDGSETDNWTKNAHAKWINAFEDSNSGYSWDWDASKLKGKLFGITLRQCGKVIEGNHIKFNEICYPCSVEDARKNPERVGNFKAYKGFDESKMKKSSNSDSDWNAAPGSDEEVPF